MDDQIRRNVPLFPMSIVGKLTGLSARQIRYYEEHRLIKPNRSEGNRRLFSFKDVDRLLEIKTLLDKGVNLAGIKHVIGETIEAEIPVRPTENKPSNLSDADLLKKLKQELIHAGKFGKTSLIQGELTRFFH